MALLLNLGGFSLDLDAPSGSGSSSSSNWLYLGAYDNGVSYNTSDVVLYNGGLWYCYTSANLSAGYPPDSRPECWVQVSSTNFAGIDLTGISFNPSGSYGDITITGDLNAAAIQAPAIYVGSTQVALQGDNVSGFNNDAGYINEGNSSPTLWDISLGSVGGYLSAILGSMATQSWVTNYGFLTSAAQPGDYVSEFYNDAGYINAYGDGSGGMYPTYISLGYPSSATHLYADGSASFANGAATIDTSGILSIGNSVSSSSDNSIDSKVEIVINGTTYYLLASTSAS